MNIWPGSWGIVSTTLARIQNNIRTGNWIVVYWFDCFCQLMSLLVQKMIIIASSFWGNPKKEEYYSDRQMKCKQTNQMKAQILFIYIRLILVEKGKQKRNIFNFIANNGASSACQQNKHIFFQFGFSFVLLIFFVQTFSRLCFFAVHFATIYVFSLRRRFSPKKNNKLI